MGSVVTWWAHGPAHTSSYLAIGGDAKSGGGLRNGEIYRVREEGRGKREGGTSSFRARPCSLKSEIAIFGQGRAEEAGVRALYLP